MEQQLQAEIKKNKNLLQSNFTLMQENELFAAALTELKKYLSETSLSSDDYQQAACADDAQAIVSCIIKKMKELQQLNETKHFITQQKNANKLINKQCECQKWKIMYSNESEESLRLSRKIVQLQKKISNNESKHEQERKQMDNILKQYLIIFKRVNSVDFLQAELAAKKIKQSVKQNKNDNPKTSKQKRSTSRSKNITSRSQQKKSQKVTIQSQKQIQQIESVPSKVSQQLAEFGNFISYLDGLRQDLNNMLTQNKILREQLSDAQTMISIYRQKQRERIMNNKFLIQ